MNIFYELGKWLDDLAEYKSLSKREREIKKKVPYTCFYCELLGICRDELNGWKCRHGCMVLDNKDFIPYRCKKCNLLYQCRDKDNGWKCYNGCIILNEERKHK
jgi:hypothetical protein